MSSRLTVTVGAIGLVALIAVLGAPQVALAYPGGDGGGDGGPIVIVGGGGFGSGVGEVDTGIGIGSNQKSDSSGGGTSNSDGPTQQASDGNQSADQAGDVQQDGSTKPQTCIDLRLVTPSPPAGDPRWNGADPTTHDLYSADCIYAFTLIPLRAWAYLIADKGKAPTQPPAPPNPTELASTVWAHMRTLIPAPGATTSPDLPHNRDADTGQSVTYVNLWMWYWTPTAVWKPISQTLSERGVTVTVTATPDTLTFNPGNGDRTATCETPPGRPWTPADGNSNPERLHGCGYQYTRLNAAGHTMAATLSISWTVSWTSNLGISGQLAPIVTSTLTVPFVIEQIPVEVK
jgi:hypothetical protein